MNEQGPGTDSLGHTLKACNERLVPSATTTLQAPIESSAAPAPPCCAFAPPSPAIGELGELHERILCHRAVRSDRHRGCRARCRRQHEQRPGYKCGFADHSLHPPWLVPPSTSAR